VKINRNVSESVQVKQRPGCLSRRGGLYCRFGRPWEVYPCLLAFGACSGLASIDEGTWRKLRLRPTAGLGKREVAGEEDLRAQEEEKIKQEGAGRRWEHR